MTTRTHQCGWIPPEQRTKEQALQHAEWEESLPKFDDVLSIVDTPDMVLLHELEIKVTGSLLPRIWQKSGSCVGAGGARAYTLSMVGDVYHRGDQEEVKIPWPWATYGVGRKIAGMRGKGEGSYGGAQAKAVEQFGMLPWDSKFATPPTIKDGWAVWSSAIEVAWSHSDYWKYSYDEVAAEANLYTMQTVTKITDIDQVPIVMAQGYGLTSASNYGTRPSVVDGVLLGRWNLSWAHQMANAGYLRHPKLGLLIETDNQWGNVHGLCPILSKLGVNGSFWNPDFAKLIKNGEVYAHSNTKGFPKRVFDWDNILSL